MCNKWFHFQTFSQGRAGFLAAGMIAIFFTSMLRAQTTECRPCCQIARSTLKADIAETQQDYWIAIAKCQNMTLETDKSACRQQASDDLLDAVALAERRNTVRLRVCRLIGDDVYAPAIDPEQFVDFAAVLSGQETLVPNRFFPLTPGTFWEYMAIGQDNLPFETNRVEVLNQTKEILGVNCIVVRDRVWEIDNGTEILVEDTLDYFAQNLDGTVWYFGELSQSFEDGDLVSLEGSWQAGRDGAQPGIVMKADPQVGDVYRQEFLIGEAEDVAKVISRDEVTVSVPFGTFSDDVLRTREWSALEPDAVEFKFYAPDVGLVLETDPDTGDEVVLVDRTEGEL